MAVSPDRLKDGPRFTRFPQAVRLPPEADRNILLTGARRACNDRNTFHHDLHPSERMSVEYFLSRGPRDVERILALQAENHRDVVDAATARQDGFTSVRHDPAVLQAMNRAFPSAVAFSGETIAGYALMMAQ